MSHDCSEPGDAPDRVAQLIAPPVPLPGNAGPAIEGHGAAPIAENSKPSAEFADLAMDDAAKQQFLWHVHEYLGEHTRFGDTKAAFSGAIASALLGALYTARAHVQLLSASIGQWTLFTWLSAMGGVFLVASVALAIWTVLPRRRSTQSKGFIYWDSIAAHGFGAHQKWALPQFPCNSWRAFGREVDHAGHIGQDAAT